MSQAQAAEIIRLDGRRMRTEDSRRRVVEALLACVSDGDFDPSAETVAQRAGVGLRTVFRLFKDKEGLISEMSNALLTGCVEAMRAPFKGQTWRERLDELMERRFAAYEQVMAYRRAALAHAHASSAVRENNRALFDQLRRNLAAVLPESARVDGVLLEALDMALSVDAWIRLRIDQGLDSAAAGAAARRMAAALTSELA